MDTETMTAAQGLHMFKTDRWVAFIVNKYWDLLLHLLKYKWPMGWHMIITEPKGLPVYVCCGI